MKTGQYTHPRGEKQWLNLFSAVKASSVPREDIEEESVCSDRALD
jgi:hypothetical protein